MGLVEHEWLATLASIEVGDVTYIDFVEEGRRLEPLLRQAGCDVVVALTHMRVPNDQRLGREVPGIDIILGGHDHHYEVRWARLRLARVRRVGVMFGSCEARLTCWQMAYHAIVYSKVRSRHATNNSNFFM